MKLCSYINIYEYILILNIESRSSSLKIFSYLQVGIVGPLDSVSGPADAEAADLEKGKLVDLTKLLNSVCSAIGGQLA